MASALQTKQRKVSWARRQIKGGTSNFINSAKELGLKDGELNQLLKTIYKLEATMLNQLDEHWEVFRAVELHERAST